MDTDTPQQPPEFDADAEAKAMWDRAQQFIKSNEAQPEPAKVDQVVEPAPANEPANDDPAPVDEKPDAAQNDKPDTVPEDFPKKSQATPEAITTWKDMKAELKQLREERDTLKNTLPEKDKTVQEKLVEIEQMKAKIAEFEGKDISAFEKRIQDMESAIKERDDKLTKHEQFRAIHDVQSSEAYAKEVLEPAAKIGEAVDVLAKLNDVDPKVLQGVLEVSDPVEQRRKIREITQDWHPSDSAELASHARETQELLKRSAEMFENAEKTKQEISLLEQDKQRRAKDDEEKQFLSANEAANKLIQEKIPFLKDNKEAMQAVLNAEIKKDPASMAVAARASVILPHLLRQLDERNAKIAELEQSIKSRVAASPRPTSTQAPASTKDDLPSGYDVDSIMARFNAHMNKA